MSYTYGVSLQPVPGCKALCVHHTSPLRVPHPPASHWPSDVNTRGSKTKGYQLAQDCKVPRHPREADWDLGGVHAWERKMGQVPACWERRGEEPRLSTRGPHFPCTTECVHCGAHVAPLKWVPSTQSMVATHLPVTDGHFEEQNSDFFSLLRVYEIPQ